MVSMMVSYHVFDTSGVFRGGAWGRAPPLRRAEGGRRPPLRQAPKSKIVKKWPENASREVKKSKIFLPRRRGHSFPWTPFPFGPRFFPPRPPLGKRSDYAPALLVLNISSD